MSLAKDTRVSLIPTVRYRDCSAALTQLTETFGFTEGTVYRDDNGNVMHAEVHFGNGMLMIGPVADTPFARVMKQPDDVGGVTASFFCITNDPDALFARCAKAGLETLLPLQDHDYGSREFSVRDLGGHVWTFGTYDPWASGAA